MKYITQTLKTFALLLTTVALASCASGAKFSSNIHTGMTKDDVVDIMGAPDVYKTNQFLYTDRLVSGFSWDKASYFVNFNSSGVVDQYGRYNYRERRYAPAPMPASVAPQPQSATCTSSNNGLGQIVTNCESN